MRHAKRVRSRRHMVKSRLVHISRCVKTLQGDLSWEKRDAAMNALWSALLWIPQWWETDRWLPAAHSDTATQDSHSAHGQSAHTEKQ